MKSTVAALLLAALAAAPVAEAQTGSCRASITYRQSTVSKVKEKTWDIIFDIAAPACDASRGVFEYQVNLRSGEKIERVSQVESFETSDGKRTALRFSYHAGPGQEVVDVTGISVRECSCRPNN